MMQRRTFALLCSLWFTPFCQAGLFDNQQQQAGKLFQQGDYEAAAEKFTDSYRRGVAQYRAGQYGKASASFARVQRETVKTDALYNLGNSRFQEGKLETAAEAYRQVLLRKPDYENARHNLGLTSAMLAEASQREKEEQDKQDKQEQKEQEQEKQQQSEDKQSEQQKQDKQQQSKDEQSEQQQSSDEQQKQDEQQQSEDEQQSGDEQSEQQESSSDQQEQQQQGQGQEQDEQQQSGDEQSEQQDQQGQDQKQQSEQQSAQQPDDQESASGKQSDKQQQSAAMDESTQENGDKEDHSAQKSDGAEQPEEAREDGRSGDQRSDSGNDEQTQDQRSTFGEEPTIEDSGKGEQADEADASTAESGDRDRGADGDITGLPQQAQGGGEQDGETADGSHRDLRGRQAGDANDPRDFDPTRANMNRGAIEQFDQLGGLAGSEGDDSLLPGEISGTDGSSTVTLMDQLLDQVEGNPVNLMRNQFMLEEQRLNQNGGHLYEPRPW